MKDFNNLYLQQDKILNSYKFLIYLFPIFIITGNFLLNGVVILSLLLLFYIVVKLKNLKKFGNMQIIFTSLLFSYLIISSIISGQSYSIESSIRYLRFLPFILIMYFLFNTHKEFELKLLKYFNVILIFVIVDGIFQYFYGFNLLGFEKIKSHRISGFFGDELILGSFISKYIFLFYIYFACYRQNNKLLFVLLLLPLIFLTYVSGERVAFFSTLLFSIFATIKIFKLKKILLIFGMLTLVILTTTFFDETTRERMLHKTIDQIEFLKEWKNPKKILFFSRDHNAHYQSAYLMFKKGSIKEKLFGRGVKSFKINCSLRKFCDTLGGCCSTHPHNIFFQILAEIGLIGLGMYIYFYLFLTHNLIRYGLGKENNLKYYLLNLALFVNLLPFVPSGNLFGSFMSMNFAILLSYSMHVHNDK